MSKAIVIIQRSFLVQRDLQEYKNMRNVVIQLQRKWREILKGRYQEKMYKSILLIQTWWKMKFSELSYKHKISSINTVNRCWRGALGRKRARAYKCAYNTIGELLSRGTKIIFLKIQNTAAREIQRWFRGHLIRCRHYKKVLRIRKTKREFISDRAVRILQRSLRGFLVRRTLRRMNSAAFMIQGFLKMKWLSIIFQQLKRATIMIQRNVNELVVEKTCNKTIVCLNF